MYCLFSSLEYGDSDSSGETPSHEGKGRATFPSAFHLLDPKTIPSLSFSQHVRSAVDCELADIVQPDWK